MNLILVKSGKAEPEENNLYLRTRLDADGDISVEVSRDASFSTYKKLMFFTKNEGKVRVCLYGGLSGYEDVVALEDGQIVVEK